MRVSRQTGARMGRLVLGAVLLLALTACAGPQTRPTEPADSGALRLIAVGDSITEADSPDFAGGGFGPESWVGYVVGPDISFAGGWARWGATTAEMARSFGEVEGDVLVIMAGTNDVALGVPFDETAGHLAAIAAEADAPEVILSGIAPVDHAPEAVAEFNVALESLAQDRGWHWVDAGAAVRTSDHRFAPGMASDGVHPTARGAELLGEAIGTAIDGISR